MSARSAGKIYQWSDLTESQTIRADVCVVGSGCGGATVAKKLAEVLGLPETQVSIKATTTERLGFTGRGLVECFGSRGRAAIGAG